MAGNNLAGVVDQHRDGTPEPSIMSAIWRTCFLECVRALRANGLSAADGW